MNTNENNTAGAALVFLHPNAKNTGAAIRFTVEPATAERDAGRDGLFHNAPAWTASVTMKRSEDPNRVGFILGVGVTPKADPNARRYHTFCFWPAEAFALRAALMAKFGELAFGA